jgi:hypothetical protein
VGRRTKPQRLVGQHSVYQTNTREFELTCASPHHDQKQAYPVFDVSKEETLSESNRALPFNTTYDKKNL